MKVSLVKIAAFIGRNEWAVGGSVLPMLGTWKDKTASFHRAASSSTQRALVQITGIWQFLYQELYSHSGKHLTFLDCLCQFLLEVSWSSCGLVSFPLVPWVYPTGTAGNGGVNCQGVGEIVWQETVPQWLQENLGWAPKSLFIELPSWEAKEWPRFHTMLLSSGCHVPSTSTICTAASLRKRGEWSGCGWKRKMVLILVLPWDGESWRLSVRPLLQQSSH